MMQMTSAVNVFVLMVYVVTSVAGLTAIKSSIFGSVGFFCGLALYGLGFAIWYWLLTVLPLSKAFPVAAGCLIIGTQVAAKYALNESMTALHLAGVLIIILGVTLVFLPD
jgi:multidrug transporter EmrE-like cation transporter